MDWNRQHSGDPYAYQRHKSQKCAEILVPHCVEPKYLIGAYVVNQTVASQLASLGFTLPITNDSQMFFH